MDKTSGSGNGEAEGKDRKKVPMDKDGRDLPAYHWKLAVDERYVQPLRQAQLEGRRELEGRLRFSRYYCIALSAALYGAWAVDQSRVDRLRAMRAL